MNIWLMNENVAINRLTTDSVTDIWTFIYVFVQSGL